MSPSDLPSKRIFQGECVRYRGGLEAGIFLGH